MKKNKKNKENKVSARTPVPHAVLLPAKYALIEELGKHVAVHAAEAAQVLCISGQEGRKRHAVLAVIRASSALTAELLKY